MRAELRSERTDGPFGQCCRGNRLTVSIEAFEAGDAAAVVRVVRAVFDEYGFTWEPDGYCADIHDVPGHYVDRGSAFWVARVNGDVVGCAGVSVHDGVGELHRMYLLRAHRGQGIGQRLLDVCVDEVKRRGVEAMRIWSDVLLPDAHRLYLKNGFERRGERICDDPDQSREYGFWKEPL